MIDKTTTIGPFGDVEKEAIKAFRTPKLIKICLILLMGWLAVTILLAGYRVALVKAKQIESWAVQRFIDYELAVPVIIELDSKGKLTVRDGADLTLPEAKKALVYYKLRSEGLQAGLNQVAETLAMTMDAYANEQ